MLKWDLKEKYDKQNEGLRAILSKHDGAVNDAESKLSELLAQKQELLRREFTEGRDLSADRSAVTSEIKAAEASLQEAKEMRSAASSFVASSTSKPDSISILDLTMDWNENYMQTVRKTELGPIVQKMMTAREQYYNALLDFYELRDEYGRARSEMAELESRDANQGRRVSYSVSGVEEEYNLPLITADGQYKIKKYRQMPEGIERKKGGAIE